MDKSFKELKEEYEENGGEWEDDWESEDSDEAEAAEADEATGETGDGMGLDGSDSDGFGFNESDEMGLEESEDSLGFDESDDTEPDMESEATSSNSSVSKPDEDIEEATQPGKSFDEIKQEYDDTGQEDDPDFSFGSETEESGGAQTEPSPDMDMETDSGDAETVSVTDSASDSAPETPTSAAGAGNPEADYFERLCNSALAGLGFREVGTKRGDEMYFSRYRPPTPIRIYTGHVDVKMKYNGDGRMLFEITSEKDDLRHAGRVNVHKYVVHKETETGNVLRPTDERMFLEVSFKKVFEPYVERAKEESETDDEYDFGNGNVDPELQQRI
ncbi:MAG: hypothetical protein SV253_05110 [Halobacteria archaeon]|nr:hypothetical protein [Halobacteria archaeon]